MTGDAAAIDRGVVAEFLAIAFGWSWLVAAALVAADVDVDGVLATGPLLVYMWGPAIGAVVVRHRHADGVFDGLGLARGRLRWLPVAWLLPLALLACTMAIALAHPAVSVGVDLAPLLEGQELGDEVIAESEAALANPSPTLIAIVLGVGLVAGGTVNAVVALGEELGWRGLLLDELAPLGFWRVSALTGVAWGLWHAPVVAGGYNFPDASPLVAVLTMTVATVALSPVYTYVAVRGASVFPAAVLHGTFNAVAGFGVLYLTGASFVWISPVGLAGAGAAVAVTLGCLLHDRFVADEPITTGAPLSPWTGGKAAATGRRRGGEAAADERSGTP